MCLGNASAPPPVNAAGQALTPAMRAQLYGTPGVASGDLTTDYGNGFGNGRAAVAGMSDPATALQAWETGTPEGLSRTLDPALALERAMSMAGVTERASVGEGIGGLFGFGRYAGKVPDFGVPELPPLTTNTPKAGGK